MENSKAFVATLKNIRPIEGADKIVQADVTLNDIPVTSIVTGVDTKENTLVVYFDSNMCLSDQVIKDMPDLARYLAKGNRVRVVRLKGCISNGLVVPVKEFLRYKSEHIYVEGLSFTTINGLEICHKYAAPIKCQSSSNGNKKGRKGKTESRIISDQFHFHIDTDQLVRNAFKIKHSNVISISRKIHGCVSENSIVNTMEFGDKKIKEIVDDKIQCSIKAFSTISNEIVYAPIDDFYFKENDGDWYEIELENGSRIEITSNNPVWLPKLKCYRKVEDLNENDYLLFE